MNGHDLRITAQMSGAIFVIIIYAIFQSLYGRPQSKLWTLACTYNLHSKDDGWRRGLHGIASSVLGIVYLYLNHPKMRPIGNHLIWTTQKIKPPSF